MQRKREQELGRHRSGPVLRKMGPVPNKLAAGQELERRQQGQAPERRPEPEPEPERKPALE